MKQLSLDELVTKYANVHDPSLNAAFLGLDEIDWESVHHAYGKASNIPALLHALLAPEREDREFALAILIQEVCHQGCVFEASARIVPFLFRILEVPDAPDRGAIAALLASLSIGTPGTNKEPKLKWVNATKGAVEDKLQLLYPFLLDADPEVRFFIVKALAEYPGHSQEFLPRLERMLETEADGNVRKAIYDLIYHHREQ